MKYEMFFAKYFWFWVSHFPQKKLLKHNILCFRIKPLLINSRHLFAVFKLVEYLCGKKPTMIILTLWVTGFGLLSSSSASTRAKWLSCQIGRPSRLSLESYTHRHTWAHAHISTSYRDFCSPRCHTSSLPPGPGRRRQGRRSWRQSNWPRRTYSQNNTWSLTEAHLQNKKTRKYSNYFATHFPMSWSMIIKNTAQSIQ